MLPWAMWCSLLILGFVKGSFSLYEKYEELKNESLQTSYVPILHWIVLYGVSLNLVWLWILGPVVGLLMQDNVHMLSCFCLQLCLHMLPALQVWLVGNHCSKSRAGSDVLSCVRFVWNHRKDVEVIQRDLGISSVFLLSEEKLYFWMLSVYVQGMPMSWIIQTHNRHSSTNLPALPCIVNADLQLLSVTGFLMVRFV